MSDVLHFCLLMPGLVFSLCALNVVTDSMLTKAVSAADTGEPVRGRGPPGPPLWEALWAVSDGAAPPSPISGWVCPGPVSTEWGGWPGVQVAGGGGLQDGSGENSGRHQAGLGLGGGKGASRSCCLAEL